MILLEDQLVSIELSQRLKDLGVPQNSVFYFVGGAVAARQDIYTFVDNIDGNKISIWDNPDNSQDMKGPAVSAFTETELTEMLPREIEINKEKFWLCFEVANLTSGKVSELKGHACGYRNNNSWYRPFFENIKGADAKADMLIHLIESGVVKV